MKARIAALCSLIVTITAMSLEKIAALALQSVDTALEIDVEPRSIVDREWPLRGKIRISRVQGLPQALVVETQEARQVHPQPRDLRRLDRRPIHAVLRPVEKMN